jgi:hypothetical protein
LIGSSIEKRLVAELQGKVAKLEAELARRDAESARLRVDIAELRIAVAAGDKGQTIDLAQVPARTIN